MNDQKLETMPPPPGVFGSLKAGFDVVSNQIVLILLPLALDVLLWLGPRVSVGNLYRTLMNDWIDFSSNAGFPLPDVQLLAERIDMLGRVNVLNWMRTFPVGIPSLLSGILPESLPLQTPLGTQDVIQVSSLFGLLGWLVLLTVLGWVGGSLYFRWVSNSALKGQDEVIGSLNAVFQTFILSLIWLIGLMVIIFPVMLLVMLFASINAILGNIVVFIILMLSFWLIVPLFFMPLGIFVRKQNAFYSVSASLKLSRFTLPTSSLFVFSVIILSTGLNSLWSVPSSDSWMMLVGIAGHAFITTALLAASFIYYRNMTDWLQDVYERFQQFGGRPSSTV